VTARDEEVLFPERAVARAGRKVLTVTQRTAAATIRFSATLSAIDTSTVLRLPETASKSLPSRGQVAVRGTINGAEFQTVLARDAPAVSTSPHAPTRTCPRTAGSSNQATTTPDRRSGEECLYLPTLVALLASAQSGQPRWQRATV